MKASRVAIHGAVNAVLIIGLSWALVGCRDSSPLTSIAPHVAPTASVTAAGASSTEFDGFDNNCSSGEITDFIGTRGGTLHFKVSNENRWITGNSLIDGIESNTGGANVISTGQGVVRLSSSLKPDAVDGTWQLQTHLSLPDFVGSGVGYGTGELQGMTIKFTFDLAAGPSDCNPDGPKGHVHGVILSPAS
jgi:hypothetical protein